MPSTCSARTSWPSTSPTARQPAGTSGSTAPTTWHFRLDGADYLAEGDADGWSLSAKAPAALPDVTVTATAQDLAAFIFGRPDTSVEITGEAGQVERFRRLIGAMAAVAEPAADAPAGR